MCYKAVVFIGVCVAIARTDLCSKTKTALSVDDLYCCQDNTTYWSMAVLSHDPCFEDIGEDSYHDFNCRVECFYKEHNLITDGKVNLENVEKLLAPIDDEATRATFMEAYKNCDKMGNEKLENTFEDDGPWSVCENYYMTFDTCIALNIMARCPQELMDGKPYCARRIDFLNKCIFN